MRLDTGLKPSAPGTWGFTNGDISTSDARKTEQGTKNEKEEEDEQKGINARISWKERRVE